MPPNNVASTRGTHNAVAISRQRHKKREEIERRRKVKLLVALMCTVIAFTVAACLDASVPMPMHTSILTGQLWLDELLSGHPDRFRDQLGMAKQVFHRLSFELQAYSGLVSTKYVTSDEKLATFLHFARTGCNTRMLQERFQRSADTIHRYEIQRQLVMLKIFTQFRSIYTILRMLVGPFYKKYLHLPPDETPPEIKGNSKLYPYFRNCRGAIDGSHFHAWVLSECMARYRNRKGFIGQNVLAACNFSMLFVYILSGWEGSASDSLIYHYARERDFAVPAGKYYLADAGFPLCDALLTPYRAVRYHLKEWGTVRQRYVSDFEKLILLTSKNSRPKTPEELFNLRHSQARNVVERIFGVVKHRWSMFTRAPEYPIETQAMMIAAVGALHNFVKIHDDSDNADDLDGDDEGRTGQPEGSRSLGDFIETEPREVSTEELGIPHISDEEKARASARRDRIAKKMWEDYVAWLAARGEVPNA